MTPARLRAEPPRALSPPGVFKRTAPFAIASVVGMAILLFTAPTPSRGPLWAVALAVVHAVAAWAVPWRRLPRWAETVLPLTYVAILALLREGFAGGLLAFAVGPLFLLPLFWAALYATRREVLLVLVAVAAAVLVPRLVRGSQAGELGIVVLGLSMCTALALATEAFVRSRREAAVTLRALIDALPTPLAVQSRGKVDYANAALARMLGYRSPAELAGASVSSWVAAERAPSSAGPSDVLLDCAGGVVLAEVQEVAITYDDRPARAVIYRDVTAERAERAASEREANTDALTGIANRRAAEQALARAAERARRDDAPLSVAIFDVDHFKRINDAFGHRTGDDVLQRVARVLSGEARLDDVVARWGGEEFVAVLRTSLGGAIAFCERVRASVEAHAGDAPVVTLSAGVAELAPGEGVEAALDRADRCLYEAKRAGRNRVAS